MYVCMYVCMYRVTQKTEHIRNCELQGAPKLLPLTSPNADRFSKRFHRQPQKDIYNKVSP